MMRNLILLCLFATEILSLPSEQFTDGGFQPIEPPKDAIIRKRTPVAPSAAASAPAPAHPSAPDTSKRVPRAGPPGHLGGGINTIHGGGGAKAHFGGGGFRGAGGGGRGVDVGVGGFRPNGILGDSYSAGSGPIGVNVGGGGGGHAGPGKAGGFAAGGGGAHFGGGFGVGGGGNFGGGGAHAGGVGGRAGGSAYSGAGHQGATEPVKTIYVNIPPEDYGPAPPPISAGPPRKHYRIVFIKSPQPPPPPQHILPPRIEQKTLIYVLHPKQAADQQQVIQVPEGPQHDPQVYFIQYDKEPPTAKELQSLVQETISGQGPAGGRPGPGQGGGQSYSSGSQQQQQQVPFASGLQQGFSQPLAPRNQYQKRNAAPVATSKRSSSPASEGVAKVKPRLQRNSPQQTRNERQLDSRITSHVGPFGFGLKTKSPSEK